MQVTSETDKIRIVASTLLQARKRKWNFLTMKEFSAETGLTREELMQIVDLFKKAKIFNYNFLPFDNPDKKRSIFDDKDDIRDEKGAISFFPTNLNKPVNMDKFLESQKWGELSKIVRSDEVLLKFMQEVSYTPTVIYDSRMQSLLFRNHSVKVSSGNQHILCNILFSVPLGTPVLENDIADKFEEGEKGSGYSVLYGTKDAINRKFEKETGIKNLIEFKDGKMLAEINPLK